MSMSSCSLCLPDVNELRELNTDLAKIDNLEGKYLTAEISRLLACNLSLINSISTSLSILIRQRYFPCGQILNDILPYEEYIYSSEIDNQIAANNDLSRQRNIAKEMRILNLKLKVLLGNITNISTQLLCSP